MKKKKIELLNEIKNNLQNDTWKHKFTTNCYAYALNLDVPEFLIKKNAYAPGNISGAYHDIKYEELFTYKTFIENLYSDFDYLNLEYEKIDPNDKVSLDEWKIAIYLLEYVKETKDEDALYLNFHFLKNINGTWNHKKWFKNPSEFDSKNKLITDPINAYIENYTYIDTFKLKLKKK